MASAGQKGGNPRGLPASVLVFACKFSHCVDRSIGEDPVRPTRGHQTGRPLVTVPLRRERAGFRGQQRASRDHRIPLARSQATVELGAPSRLPENALNWRGEAELRETHPARLDSLLHLEFEIFFSS